MPPRSENYVSRTHGRKAMQATGRVAESEGLVLRSNQWNKQRAAALLGTAARLASIVRRL
jgi:hypothetical protein